jgi:hypothetical protein
VHPAQAAPARLHRSEALVHIPVGRPPAALEDGLLDQPVQQRPERPVREAVVVVLDLAPAQRNREELDVEPLDAAREVAGAAVPADPGAVPRLERRAKRADEPARRRPPALTTPRYRRPVRVRDEAHTFRLPALPTGQPPKCEGRSVWASPMVHERAR